MIHSEYYLKSFGKLTEKQEKVVMETCKYQMYLLADTLEDLKKEFWNSLVKIFSRSPRQN